MSITRVPVTSRDYARVQTAIGDGTLAPYMVVHHTDSQGALRLPVVARDKLDLLLTATAASDAPHAVLAGAGTS